MPPYTPEYDASPTSSARRPHAVWLAGLLPLLVVGMAYAVTLQTHISGSFEENTPANILKNEYIKDVSEIQVALNTWGTIHHTGYPLFAILGNLITAPLRALGVAPAEAASVVALLWGVVTLASTGLLIVRLTGRPVLAAACIGVLGVARSIWIHNVVAEVYSMSLAITALMLLVALWPAAWSGAWSAQRRVLVLALLGGIGVAHHRAVIFVAPGLLLAVWPHLRAEHANLRRLIPRALGLGLIGFVPYVYLPLRARMGGAWVYGEPGTLRGLWVEFSGKEADRLIKPPGNLSALWNNVSSVWSILVHELTLPGLVIAVAALIVAMLIAPQRRAARIVALSAAGPALFATVYHTAVLPEAILMPVVWALVVGVALAVDELAHWSRRVLPAAVIGLVVWMAVLIGWQIGYVRTLVDEPSGVETIARLAWLPRDGKTALMLPWGPHFAAASYARLVTGEYRDVVMVNHKGDYPHLLSESYRLFTLPETFYTYPPPWPSAFGAPSDWWTAHIGRLSVSSAAPGIIELLNTPRLAGIDTPPGTPIVYNITQRAAWLTCDAGHIYAHVIWGADARPTGDPSIFVHLTGDTPAPNPPNADSRYPVYGLYPFSQWSPGEIVRDDFTLPRLPDKTQVRIGLYDQDANGQFTNYGEQVLAVADCTPEAPR